MPSQALVAVAPSEAARLVEATERILGGPDGGPAARLARHLFERTAEEDLTALTAEDLARLASRALEFLAPSHGDAPRIRIVEETISSGETITVVETLNDDMPFLFDSVMGALVEAGHEIRLVAHPVLPVVRDGAGRLSRLVGAGDPAGRRESFIHIHLTRLAGEAARGELAASLEATLTDVRAAVAAWKTMGNRFGELVGSSRWGTTP